MNRFLQKDFVNFFDFLTSIQTRTSTPTPTWRTRRLWTVHNRFCFARNKIFENQHKFQNHHWYLKIYFYKILPSFSNHTIIFSPSFSTYSTPQKQKLDPRRQNLKLNIQYLPQIFSIIHTSFQNILNVSDYTVPVRNGDFGYCVSTT